MTMKAKAIFLCVSLAVAGCATPKWPVVPISQENLAAISAAEANMKEAAAGVIFYPISTKGTK